MAKIKITYDDLNEIEQIIYNNLKTLKDPNSSLNKDFQEIKRLYNMYSYESKYDYEISFNDKANRFNRSNFNDSSLFYKQNHQHSNVIARKNLIKIADELYLKISKLAMDLKNESSINYAIYFTSNGRVYRTFTETLDIKAMKMSSDQLLLDKNEFKKRIAKEKANNKKELSYANALDVTEHFNTFYNYLEKTYRGNNLLSVINNGHIAEAFERHLQQMHNGLKQINNGSLNSKQDQTEDEPQQLIRMSSGNDPWYTGGDVFETQVKFLGTGSTVQLTAFNTIEDMFNYLNHLEETLYNDEKLIMQAKDTYKLLYNGADDIINQTANEIIDEIIEKEKKQIKKAAKEAIKT